MRKVKVIEGLKEGNTQKIKQSLLSKFFLSRLRAVDSTPPLEETSKVAGPSSTEGRVVRRQKEVRKASAFMERWLQAGGATGGLRPEQDSAKARDCRWVGSGNEEGTQVRGQNSIGRKVFQEKEKEGVGGGGAEELQESTRDRTENVRTTEVASDSKTLDLIPWEAAPMGSNPVIQSVA